MSDPRDRFEAAVICAADILVEAGEHCQLDDLLVIDADVSQGPGRSARGPDDDRGTTGIGLGRARAQVCDATHRQPGRAPIVAGWSKTSSTRP